MRTISAFIFVVLLLGGHSELYSQIGFGSSAEQVSVETYLSFDNVHPGSEFHAALQLDIADRWHINAHRPTLDYLIGTELTLEEIEGIEILGIDYPEPVQYQFAFADDILDVYEGTEYIFLRIRVSRDLEPGQYTLNGTLRVQACDDQVCLPPSDKEVRFQLPVADYSVPSNKIHQDIFPDDLLDRTDRTEPEPDAVPDAASEFAAMLDQQGLLIAFLGIFFIGLALNLTPCVYPMLTITVSLFGAQTDKRTSRVFFKALIYVLGIATMYSSLGVIAALTGGLFGGLLQSPWVLAGIGLLFLLLALSMFGLYDIQIPYWVTNRLGGAQTAGLLGIFVSGLVVGIFAAPCIGPPIIALLAFVGHRGDPLFGFASFFVLSMGLGLPYLLLGTFSGLLTKLPKSGEWMVWVKKVFGIVLVAVGVFFICLAYDPSWMFLLVPAALVLGGIYLGFLERSTSHSRAFPWIKRAVGIAAIAGGIAFFYEGMEPSFEWQPYTSERLAEAQQAATPVILYFSADWCIPCLELDRRTFTDEQVIGALNDLATLKVDLTHFDSPESQELRERFNIAGVPTIIFLDEQGQELNEIRVVGYVPPDDLLERVKRLKT